MESIKKDRCYKLYTDSNIWNPWNLEDKNSQRQVREMFEEMIGWEVDEGIDYMIGEIFYFAEEAFCALDVIRQTDLPTVITIAPMAENMHPHFVYGDDESLPEHVTDYGDQA